MNNEIPWFNLDAIKFIKTYIDEKKNIRLLEFGSGNSTIYYEKNVDKLYSVEHNQNWYDNIKKKVNKNTNYVIKPINYISKPSTDKLFYNVSNLKDLFNDVSNEFFDIIIIDGIHRVNSFFGSIDYLKKGGLIVLDDSHRIDNPETDGSYKPIEEYCKNFERYKFRNKSHSTDIWIKL